MLRGNHRKKADTAGQPAGECDVRTQRIYGPCYIAKQNLSATELGKKERGNEWRESPRKGGERLVCKEVSRARGVNSGRNGAQAKRKPKTRPRGLREQRDAG